MPVLPKPKTKPISKMSRKEILEIDDSDITLGSKAKIAVLPEKPEHFKIEDFFIAAAERKGATNLRKLLKKADREVIREGKQYKIEYLLDDGTFTIYSDGTWAYDRKPTFLDGRLQCPHAKGWIKKMIDKGTPGEFAKMDWAEYYKIRHQV
jgi:hypothetical protein